MKLCSTLGTNSFKNAAEFRDFRHIGKARHFRAWDRISNITGRLRLSSSYVDRLIPMPSERQKIKRREFAPYFDTKHKSSIICHLCFKTPRNIALVRVYGMFIPIKELRLVLSSTICT